jgi:hypothetical protein
MDRITELEKEIKNRIIASKEKFKNIKTKEDVRTLLVERRNLFIKNDVLDDLLRVEDYVIARISNKVDWNNFEPDLIEVVSSNDEKCYNYLKTVSTSFPHSGYVGRQLKFLLVDKISTNILGIASIGSDLCIIGERDKIIGWTHKQKFAERKLSCGFNINICVTLSPYSTLLTGKLVTMLMFSNAIRNLWKQR